MLRYLTAGESHGPGLVAIVEGVPAGLTFDSSALADQLERRRSGHGRGNRMKLERDEFEILGGVRHGRTLGSPIAVLVRNTEWPRWSTDMSAEPGTPRRTLTTPRPGHADLVGMQKYDTHDARDILERASARETAARVVVGYIASAILDALGVRVLSHVISIGEVRVPDGTLPGPDDLDTIDADPVRCFDPATSERMVAEIDAAKADRDTLGGVVEVVAHGLWPGLGSHVHWDRKLDTQLAAALMSIQAIKGVEVGDGFTTATRRGSAAHDEILPDGSGGFSRDTNRAGGTEGGMSTGEPLRVRAAMKPISTLMRALRSVDVVTKEPDAAFRERSDVCAVPRAGVVAEHVVAIVLANEALRQFGGDTIDDVERRAGTSIPRIFEDVGEATFRLFEKAVVDDMSRRTEPVVISTGGGVVLDSENVERMRTSGTVVWLTADTAELARRVGSGAGRPLLSQDPGSDLDLIAAQRRDAYRAAAHHTVATDGEDPAALAEEVLALCRPA